MVSQFRRLKIKGAAFEKETELKFFDTSKQRMALVYGKNGSGKSTIARGFSKTIGEELDEIESANLLDEAGNVLSVGADATKKIYVFDENYIQNNVRLKENGLDTIVMLGEQVGIDSKIIDTEERIKREKEDLGKQQEICDKLNDSSSIEAPHYYILQMNYALSGDARWSGRVREIDSSRRRNASVNNDTYKNIVSKKPKKTQVEVCKEYTEKLSILRQAEAGTATIVSSVKHDYAVKYNETVIIELLAKEIERPELSKREEYLMSLVANGQGEKLEESRAYFEKNEEEICPFCFQTITTEYRMSLIESIKRVLTKVVDEHKKNLKDSFIETVQIDLTDYLLLDQNILDECNEALAALNSEINVINNYIQEKIDKPYNPIVVDKFMLQEKCKYLNTALLSLENARKKYNEPFENARKIKSELETLNDERAYYEIESLYSTFLVQEAKKQSEDKKLAECKNKLDESEKELAGLIAQKKNVNIAMEIINSCLRYVFFSKDRMVITTEDENYVLKSNGKRVKPANVSVGERNIIALCYFFVEMLTDKDKENAYGEELLAIIDDPISSFDIENKVGILSFLRERLGVFLSNNTCSKVVLLTHDLPSFFDMEKICEEMKDVSGKQVDYSLIELIDRKFEPFKYKKRHEYTELLQSVYVYAKTGDPNYEMTIGNTMRRTLETYSTFIYKKGISDVSYAQCIVDTIKDDDYKKYFQNLMYRLVLNGESHMEERARTAVDMDFIEVIDPTFKQKTAKDVISFLYILNPIHVKSHLGENADIYKDIDDWCKQIKDLDLSV